jgi:hypothetical protein
MYRYRIHMTFADGTEDHVDISGDTLAEVRQQADRHVERRNPVDYWSVELIDNGC